uniref:T2SS-T3SS_pil_N domain-containing protein n=1 Tax=Caenorhabditis tropicalis TaxID=1561998 RepID=A0A1I7TGH6_9PELO
MKFILLIAIFGAALAAPLKVEYVLAPVPLKQNGDASRLVAVVPQNTPVIVIKFDKPILADVEKTSVFEENFEEIKITDGESSIVKLKTKGNLEKPVVVSVKDKKNGDSVKVMILKNGVEEVKDVKE